MKKMRKQKLTLDQPVVYQIKVPGQLETSWLDFVGEIKIDTSSGDGLLTTTLTGVFDQAALIGFLRRLYSLGLPLILVKHMEGE